MISHSNNLRPKLGEMRAKTNYLRDNHQGMKGINKNLHTDRLRKITIKELTMILKLNMKNEIYHLSHHQIKVTFAMWHKSKAGTQK